MIVLAELALWFPQSTTVAFNGTYRVDIMAAVLKAKGYPYQYLYCQNSGHGLGNANAQILPQALEWLWQGYPR